MAMEIAEPAALNKELWANHRPELMWLALGFAVVELAAAWLIFRWRYQPEISRSGPLLLRLLPDKQRFWGVLPSLLVAVGGCWLLLRLWINIVLLTLFVLVCCESALSVLLPHKLYRQGLVLAGSAGRAGEQFIPWEQLEYRGRKSPTCVLLYDRKTACERRLYHRAAQKEPVDTLLARCMPESAAD